MSLDDWDIQPNYVDFARLPVWPVRAAILNLSRYAVDQAGWKNGNEFYSGFSKIESELGKALVESLNADEIEFSVRRVEHSDFGKVLDFENSFIDKAVFMEWALEKGFKVPPEFEAINPEYVSPRKVAEKRWAPKTQEEEKVKGFVAGLLSQGCTCDTQQMAIIVEEAHDERGTMLVDTRKLTSFIKAIKEVYKDYYKSHASLKIKGAKGFKRTHNCKLHPQGKKNNI